MAGLLPLLFVACLSTKQISIEILKPPKITLPLPANVLVLNNAVPQTSEKTILIAIDDVYTVERPVDLDSVNWQITYNFADFLSDADFFPVVDIYTERLRKDDHFLEIKQLPKELREEFDSDYDLFITIDRFLLQTGDARVSRRGHNEKTYIGSLSGELTCGVYSSYKEMPDTTFVLSDSLFLSFSQKNDSTFLFARSPDFLIRVLTPILAKTAAEKLIPDWQPVKRVIYSNFTSSMKNAYQYFKSNELEKAIDLWTMELHKKKEEKDKRYLASNIAVANEMKSDFRSAIEWAKRAQFYFKQTGKSDQDKDLIWINNYIRSLERRAVDNRILDEFLKK